MLKHASLKASRLPQYDRDAFVIYAGAIHKRKQHMKADVTANSCACVGPRPGPRLEGQADMHGNTPTARDLGGTVSRWQTRANITQLAPSTSGIHSASLLREIVEQDKRCVWCSCASPASVPCACNGTVQLAFSHLGVSSLIEHGDNAKLEPECCQASLFWGFGFRHVEPGTGAQMHGMHSFSHLQLLPQLQQTVFLLYVCTLKL